MMFRIIIPVSIITRILQELGVIDHIGSFIGPVMELVGLPGEMGLVWATALITNLYGGMVVFAALAPALSLTVAQVTVVCTMMLIAHSLPVEISIARKAGTRIVFTAILRIGTALGVGLLLHAVFTWTGYLDVPNSAIWNPAPPDPTWGGWAFGQAKTMLKIFCIILFLFFLMRILKRIGVTGFLTRILEPVLRLLGISRDAAPLAVVGIILGITYGGGLIIREAQSGRLKPRDVFFSVSLMNLSHALIEDTLLMAVLGAHVTGVLGARLVGSLLVTFIMVKLLKNIPDKTFNRFFFWKTEEKTTEPTETG
jgi:hypothetical protein